jgi:hypothetical protein
MSLHYVSQVYHIKCTGNVSKIKEATVVLFTDSVLEINLQGSLYLKENKNS